MANELKPGHMWSKCLCEEIHPDDRPCIVCVAWTSLGDTPPEEVEALYGKVEEHICDKCGDPKTRNRCMRSIDGIHSIWLCESCMGIGGD